MLGLKNWEGEGGKSRFDNLWRYPRITQHPMWFSHQYIADTSK